jgi:hypothetical protein
MAGLLKDSETPINHMRVVRKKKKVLGVKGGSRHAPRKFLLAKSLQRRHRIWKQPIALLLGDEAPELVIVGILIRD